MVRSRVYICVWMYVNHRLFCSASIISMKEIMHACFQAFSPLFPLWTCCPIRNPDLLNRLTSLSRLIWLILNWIHSDKNSTQLSLWYHIRLQLMFDLKRGKKKSSSQRSIRDKMVERQPLFQSSCTPKCYY